MRELIEHILNIDLAKDFGEALQTLPHILESMHCPPWLNATLSFLLAGLYATKVPSMFLIIGFLIFSAIRWLYRKRNRF